MADDFDWSQLGTDAAEVYAALLERAEKILEQLTAVQGFPEPEAVLSAGKAWKRTAIEKWAKAAGRLT